MDGDILAPHARAHKIVKKSKSDNALQYIDDQLQQIGIEAVDRLKELTQSQDESIATRNVQYAIDHIRGKAVNKNLSISVKHNIQSVLD